MYLSLTVRTCFLLYHNISCKYRIGEKQKQGELDSGKTENVEMKMKMKMKKHEEEDIHAMERD